MSNTYEYILPYKAEEIKNILDRLQNLPDVSGSGHSPHIGDNGNWFEWDADSNQYVDTGIKAQGEDGSPGFPTIKYYSEPVLGYDTASFWDNLYPNEELRITIPAHMVLIDSFVSENDTVSESWSITFTASKNPVDEPFTIAIPDYVEWAVVEPVFTAGYTYYLSFIPFGDKVLGVWAAKELTTDEQTVV